MVQAVCCTVLYVLLAIVHEETLLVTELHARRLSCNCIHDYLVYLAHKSSCIYADCSFLSPSDSVSSQMCYMSVLLR